jgi:hypothetical protein
MGIFVDASTSWGIDIVIDQRWIGFRLSSHWKIRGRYLMARNFGRQILFGIIASPGTINRSLLIHTMGAMAKGRSRNFHINLSVRRTYTILSAILVVPTTIYIPSTEKILQILSHAERRVSLQ